MITPKAIGCIYHHYQEVYRVFGRKAARAKQSTSGISWVYFVGESIERIQDWMESNGFAEVRIDNDYDCTGEYFAREPYIQTDGLRTLVTLHWGTDI